MQFSGNLRMYNLNKNWSKKFKPHLDSVSGLMNRAIRTVSYDFEYGVHIPREAGWCMDVEWPRNRTCARAHKMIGYCHVMVAPMLELSRLAFPKKEWFLLNAPGHSIVIDTTGLIMDLTMVDEKDDNEAISFVKKMVLDNDPHVWYDPEDYIENRLENFPFGEPRAMPDWAPRI